METLNSKIKESRARLVQQGTQFAQSTSEAGTTFVTRTKKAGENFVNQTRKASEALATSTKQATLGLAAGVREEANVWFDVLKAEKLLPEGDVLEKLPSATAAKVPSPRELEKVVLVALEDALRTIEGRVHERIEWLDKQVGPQLPATTKTAASAASSDPVTAKEPAPAKAPLTGYDDLSAKEIVARLERVSDDKAAAVLAYEQAHKKRATIVRAAEQRLAQPS
ncbi:MAG: hypothetical protein U0230_12330 [Polyangiales bacterium]